MANWEAHKRIFKLVAIMKEGCICFPLRSINNRDCMFPKFLRHQLVFLAKHHGWADDLTTDRCAPNFNTLWYVTQYKVPRPRSKRSRYVQFMSGIIFGRYVRRVQGENFPWALAKSLWKCGLRCVNPLGQAHAKIYRTNDILNGGDRGMMP